MTTNRESWLENALELLRPLFASAGYPIPERLHVSVGFPSKMALSTKKQRIGECWTGRVSADGHPHIFISPVLNDPIVALGTLVHEIIHAAIGTDHGHKAPFVKAMKALGLEGKPTATEVGDDLRATLQGLLPTLGPYPQPKFNAVALKEEVDKKKQTTRLLKAVCGYIPEGGEGEDPYIVRVTRKHLASKGEPICPCHREPMTVEGWPPEDGEDEEEDE